MSDRGARTHNFRLQSSAFKHEGEIPVKYTCEGADISPPLNWSEPPKGTKSLVLIVDDPDAPDPMKPLRTWVHWILYNIPVGVSSLPEGVQKLPQGVLAGLNDWRRAEYGGPCPPIGRHRYFHKLYALDTELENLNHPTKSELEKAMHKHIIEKVELVATYRKRK